MRSAYLSCRHPLAAPRAAHVIRGPKPPLRSRVTPSPLLKLQNNSDYVDRKKAHHQEPQDIFLALAAGESSSSIRPHQNGRDQSSRTRLHRTSLNQTSRPRRLRHRPPCPRKPQHLRTPPQQFLQPPRTPGRHCQSHLSTKWVSSPSSGSKKRVLFQAVDTL
jgi:hypothetical protein